MSVTDTVATAIDGQYGPLPRRRFDYLLHRALDLCAEMRVFGERFVAAVERKEAETFALMRARNINVISKMMLGIKQMHLAEAQQTVDSLLMNRYAQAAQLAYSLTVIGELASRIPSATDQWTDIRQDIGEPTRDDLRMSSYEKMEVDMTSFASVVSEAATGIDSLVAPLHLIPNVDANVQPLGLGASMGIGGAAFAAALQAALMTIRNSAGLLADQDNKAGRKAALTCQLQERRLQANIQGRKIKSIDQQAEIQKLSVRSVEREIELQRLDPDDVAQMEAWLKTKYTNDQMYGWLERDLRVLYSQAYTLAVSAARRAEAALVFEHGGGYWNASVDGHLAADYLYMNLKRLESISLECDPRVTKYPRACPCGKLSPIALLRPRLKGSMTSALGELLFDTDFPGHCMRCIRSIAVSIPAVLGPHTGLNATHAAEPQISSVAVGIDRFRLSGRIGLHSARTISQSRR